jgi:hypothetical protein
VVVEDIDVVGAQTLERAFDRAADVAGRAVASLAHAELRRDHGVPATAFKDLADVALAFSAAVDVRGVEVRHAGRQRSLDDAAAALVVESPTEVVRSEPDGRELDHCGSRPSKSASVSSSSSV